MKIAILLLSGGVVYRGAERSMLMLAEDFVKLGHTVTVFQAGDVPFGASFNVQKVNLPILPSSHKPTSLIGKIFERLYLDQRGILTLLFSLKLSSQLKDFDVVIPTDGFWQVLIAKLSSTAKILTVGLAGIGWTDHDTLNLNPDFFVALSFKAASWAKKINPRVTTTHIPLQVDTAEFNVEPLSLDLKRPVVITVAALTKYKRIDLVIKAASNIKDASLLIVGQGEEYDSLKKLAEKLLPGRFKIMKAAFDELPGIYKACDVFTLASEPHEAFGMVLVEAMAAGLPIVTTKDPIREEIVGNQGLYVDTTDINAYANALQNALAKPKVTSYNLQSFDRTTIAKAYLNLMR